MRTEDTDFLVLGSGIAGLSFALKAAEHGKVTVVTKSEVSMSNTSWAQGGIAAAVGEDDSWNLHEQDTLAAGAGLCNREAVRFLVQRAEPCLLWLIEIGAHFDLTPGDGLPRLSLGREGGHSRNRIVRRADHSGYEIERALITDASGRKRIQVLEHTFAENLAMSGDCCVGVFVQPAGQERMLIRSRAVLLATGSCCQVYRYSTNPPIATGDGIGLATSVGAAIENMEFIQFHPTTLYSREHRRFLISEAVRGEGAILRNTQGRRFMFDYHNDGELAPRDIVSRAIHEETQKTGTPFVHLDMTHMDPDELRERFPTILDTLSGLGIDALREPVPVVPSAHYQCGGVVTDLNGQTTIPGLYAAGEVACTGVHGANRLASNSLLEAIVFGIAAAEHAIRHTGGIETGYPAPAAVPIVSPREVEGVIFRLRKTMWDHVGIVRKNRGLEFAKGEIEEMIEMRPPGEPFYVRGAETANLLASARWIVNQAVERKTNVGLHYNSDLGTTSAGLAPHL